MQKREIINIQNLTKFIGRLCMIFLLVATCPAMLFTSSTALATEGSSGGGTETQAGSGIYSPKPITASIAAGLYHSMFVKTDGSLWVMGSNYLGQLGDGTTSDYSMPGEVAKGLHGLRQTSAVINKYCYSNKEGKNEHPKAYCENLIRS